MKRLLALALTVVAVSVPSRAQIIERPPRRVASGAGVAGDASASPSNELLQQLAFDYSPDGSRYRLKLAKLWWEVLDGKYLPIYLFSNPSLLVPSGSDSVRFTAKELLSQFGGLVNVAVAKQYALPGSKPGLIGPQGDVRVGVKYVEFPGSEDVLNGSLVGELGGSFSWYTRLWNRTTAKVPTTRPDTLTQAGTFTANLRATGNFLGGEKYRSLFRDGSDVPPALLGSWQADVSIHLFNQVLLTAGYTGSSSPLIKGMGFGGFSLSRSSGR